LRGACLTGSVEALVPQRVCLRQRHRHRQRHHLHVAPSPPPTAALTQYPLTHYPPLSPRPPPDPRVHGRGRRPACPQSEPAESPRLPHPPAAPAPPCHVSLPVPNGRPASSSRAARGSCADRGPGVRAGREASDASAAGYGAAPLRRGSACATAACKASGKKAGCGDAGRAQGRGRTTAWAHAGGRYCTLRRGTLGEGPSAPQCATDLGAMGVIRERKGNLGASG
jgi:hypothetical protein